MLKSNNQVNRKRKVAVCDARLNDVVGQARMVNSITKPVTQNIQHRIQNTYNV